MSIIRFLERTIPVAAGLAALWGASAFAQTDAPDGSQRVTARAVRGETDKRFTCGPLEYSKVVTDTKDRTTGATSFGPLPNAAVNITIPSETERCVKVVFYAETACSPTASGDYCYVRAVDKQGEKRTVLEPTGDNFNAFSSDDGTAESHAFEWIRVVGPGEHTFRIEWRVRDTPTSFFLDEFTLDVQVYNAVLGDGSD
jgi:hypothetical protein